ncbi:MAG: copper chaperone PCu(A)C [Proteobacteria bacterium]|nr:copper chaperone PCu(A)C [Pseudomonadota bacterium]
MNRRTLLATLAVLPLGGQWAWASSIMVMDAYARASLTPVAKTGAVYLQVMNHGSEADALIKVTSDASESAQVHETKMVGDVMQMRPMERLDIEPNQTVKLAPGGNHIMLEGLKAPLKNGSTISLLLTFEKAGEIRLDVPVRKIGASGDAEHQHEEGQQ